MIKINLLPVKTEKKGSNLKLQGGVAALVLLAVSATCFWFLASLDQELEDTRNQITKTEQEIAALQKIIGEIDQIKQRKADLQKKLDVIEDLERGRLDTVRAMDVIAHAMPDTVWLDNMAYKGGSVSLSGFAIDNAMIAKFIQNLNQNKQVARVILTETTQASFRNLDVVKFSLQLTVKPPVEGKQG